MNKKESLKLITVANNSNFSIRKTENQQKLENKNGNKNNYMDTSSDTLGMLHTRRLCHGSEGKTESLLRAVQNDAFKPNYIKAKANNTQQNIECKLYGDRDETVYHMISKYSKLS